MVHGLLDQRQPGIRDLVVVANQRGVLDRDPGSAPAPERAQGHVDALHGALDDDHPRGVADHAASASELIRESLPKLLPGRSSEVRPPTRQELKGTAILEPPIDQASVKANNGPPGDDDPPDGDLDVWAGVIPVQTSYGTPEPSPGLRPGIPLAQSVDSLIAKDLDRSTGLGATDAIGHRAAA